MSKKGKVVEPRVFCATTGVLWEALHGSEEAHRLVKGINCFVPWEDYQNLVYMATLLFFLQRLNPSGVMCNTVR